MKLSYLTSALAITAIGIGCSSEAGKASATSADPAKKDLAAKLQAMTPEERAKYVQEHPEEINATFSGATTNPPTGQ